MHEFALHLSYAQWHVCVARVFKYVCQYTCVNTYMHTQREKPVFSIDL
jgi:hypothetical protein